VLVANARSNNAAKNNALRANVPALPGFCLTSACPCDCTPLAKWPVSQEIVKRSAFRGLQPAPKPSASCDLALLRDITQRLVELLIASERRHGKALIPSRFPSTSDFVCRQAADPAGAKRSEARAVLTNLQDFHLGLRPQSFIEPGAELFVLLFLQFRSQTILHFVKAALAGEGVRVQPYDGGSLFNLN